MNDKKVHSQALEGLEGVTDVRRDDLDAAAVQTEHLQVVCARQVRELLLVPSLRQNPAITKWKI